MKDSKSLVIGILCAVICVMAVAYAGFTTNLTINGTGTVTSTWDVQITAVSCSATKAAGGQDLTNPIGSTGTDGLSASFSISLVQPGDTAYCDVTVKNNGTLPAKLNTTVGDNGVTYIGSTKAELAESPIKVSVVAPASTELGTASDANTNVWRVTAEYDSTANGTLTDAQKIKTVKFVLNYVQNLGA